MSRACVLVQNHGLYLTDIGSSRVSRVTQNCCTYEGFVLAYDVCDISDTRPKNMHIYPCTVANAVADKITI